MYLSTELEDFQASQKSNLSGNAEAKIRTTGITVGILAELSAL
jgi:hypothetical protein